MFEFDEIFLKLKKIDKKLLSKDFLNYYDEEFNKILLEKNKLDKVISKIKFFDNEINLLLDIINLSVKNNDLTFLDDINFSYENLKKSLLDFEIKSYFISKYDSMSAFIDIQSGSGGLDAKNWVSILLKMYLSWFKKKNFSFNILNLLSTSSSIISNVSLKITGDYAFGWLKSESGIHRLVRKSSFNSNNKRHTSFASVFVYPDVSFEKKFIIKNSDLKIDTFKSGGSGGQHVNTTDSAVRITHIPTGIVVKCQSERSQHKNRLYAIKQLESKLYALNLSIEKSKKNIFEKEKLSITWGNHIRSYIFDKSLVKDFRSNYQFNDINFILDGNLDLFVLSVIKKKLKKDDV